MKSDEPFTEDAFEASLRGLHPSSTPIDATEVFYRAGLEAGVRQRPAFGKSDFCRMFSAALLTGLVVGSFAYRSGVSSIAMPASTDVATSPTSDQSIETTTIPLGAIPVDSLAELIPSRSTRSNEDDLALRLNRYPSYAAVPDRFGISYPSGLPTSAELYRLPRRSESQVKNRTMLTVRSTDVIGQRLGELE